MLTCLFVILIMSWGVVVGYMSFIYSHVQKEHDSGWY